ncbi:MAG: hypothetical protein QOE86_2073, partial [Solirubrobacteraceae bacterium]|nr:hypothetical protein [Solirubrobacteraceae bacterium]
MKLWKLLTGWAVAKGVVQAAREGEPPDDTDPRRYETGAPVWAELATAVLLVWTAVFALAF